MRYFLFLAFGIGLLSSTATSSENIERMYRQKEKCNRFTAQFVSDLIKKRDRKGIAIESGPGRPDTYTYSYNYYCISKNKEVYSWTDYINKLNDHINPQTSYEGRLNKLEAKKNWAPGYDGIYRYNLTKFKIENNTLVQYSCLYNNSRYECDSADQVYRVVRAKRNPKYTVRKRFGIF